MCFNPSPERRVPSPNRYMAFARFCFCKNNKRKIIINQHAREPARVRSCTRDLRRHMKESVPGHSSPSSEACAVESSELATSSSDAEQHYES